MAEQAKYIIVEEVMGCYDVPFIFPLGIPHSDFAERMRITPNKILSAGFCRFYSHGDDVKVSAYGESVSLKTKALPTDARLIARTLGFGE